MIQQGSRLTNPRDAKRFEARTKWLQVATRGWRVRVIQSDWVGGILAKFRFRDFAQVGAGSIYFRTIISTIPSSLTTSPQHNCT